MELLKMLREIHRAIVVDAPRQRTMDAALVFSVVWTNSNGPDLDATIARARAFVDAVHGPEER